MGTSATTDYAPLSGEVEADVVVIGAGITGLSVALALKERGRTVTLVEAGRVASGVTGYTTAKVTLLHGLTYGSLVSNHGQDKARLYAQANQAAVEQVGRWVDRLGIACDFERMPAYTYAVDEQNVDSVRSEADILAGFGIPASFDATPPLPFAVTGAVRVDEQAQFHPRRYCLGLAAALEGDGCAIHEQTRALDVDDGETCTVTTDRGTLRARAVVLATHLPFTFRGMFFAKTHPERSYALALRTRTPPPRGMFLSVEQPSRSVRPYRSEDGEWLIVGGEGHRVGEDEQTERRYEALEAWAREVFDVESVDYRWSAQDYVPVDGIPYIGPASAGARNVYVATGFKKWGMSTGTLAGMILSDLIMGEQNAWADVFDARKLNPRASVKEFVTANAQAGKHMVGDRLAKPASLDELEPGTGALVMVGGQRVAAFRDDDGSVRAVSARCTHMGCLVHFNEAERSWDCPCHGSRFGVDGRVIQGPATKDLEPKDVTAKTT